jgi:hypothetical protein
MFQVVTDSFKGISGGAGCLPLVEEGRPGKGTKRPRAVRVRLLHRTRVVQHEHARVYRRFFSMSDSDTVVV